MKFWQCTVCKYIHEGDNPPEKCPICGVPASKFVEIDEADIPEKKRPQKKAAGDNSAPKTVPADSKTAEPKPAETGPKEEKETVSTTLWEKIENQLVKHHAHPVSVHTPNGVLPMAVILYMISWLFDAELLAQTAMVSQIFVVLSLPFVIYTGTVEWRRKYNAAITSIFKIKIVCAALTTVTCIITLAWYMIDPAILSGTKAWIFILINILMLIFAGIAGHIGGKLVFKD